MPDSRPSQPLPHPHGRMTTEHTVWCAWCFEWLQLAGTAAQVAEQARRQNGWRKSRKGWLCPQHAKEK